MKLITHKIAAINISSWDLVVPVGLRIGCTWEHAYCFLTYSFIASQAVIGRQGVAYRHIILYYLPYLWTFRRRGHLNRQKIAVVDNPQCHLTPLPRRTPRISAWTLYFEKLESVAYIFAADSMGLSSFKFVQWGRSRRRIYSATECWPKTDFDVK